jgi:hypothetical protein
VGFSPRSNGIERIWAEEGAEKGGMYFSAGFCVKLHLRDLGCFLLAPL